MSDLKAEPVSFQINGFSRYAFGDRWRFGVECEVQDCEVDPWGTLQPFGSFWLWVEGRAIGNTDVSEQLVLAFFTLRASARCAGRRADDRFSGMTNLDKLDRVRWVGWGDDDEFRPELWGGKNPDEARAEDVQPYWVIPPGDSPFFDDWISGAERKTPGDAGGAADAARSSPKGRPRCDAYLTKTPPS